MQECVENLWDDDVSLARVSWYFMHVKVWRSMMQALRKNIIEIFYFHFLCHLIKRERGKQVKVGMWYFLSDISS